MDAHSKIQQAYKDAQSYPELAQKLISIGVHSYTVDTVTGTILYRFAGGDNSIHEGNAAREVISTFNMAATIQAIRDNQQGKSDYPGFMAAIGKAGVRFYEATLEGENKRVTYIGTDGFYEEKIPV